MVHCEDVAGVDFDAAWAAVQGYIRGRPYKEFLQSSKGTTAFDNALQLFDPASDTSAAARRQCPFGTATLGALLWLWQDIGMGSLLDAAWRGLVSALPASYAIMLGVLTAIDTALSLEAWDVGPDGWPVFAVLAMLSEHLGSLQEGASSADSQSPASPVMASMREWLESSAWIVPVPLQSMATEVYYATRESWCSAAAAATLLLMPAPGGPRALPQHIATCKAIHGVRHILQPDWAIVWRGFDRLMTQRTIEVTDRVAVKVRRSWRTRSATFQMALHPPHVLTSELARHAFWFLSDRMRVYRSSHCNPAFQLTVESLAAACPRSRPLVLVEVGAHLGDCCLWAVARFGKDRVRCLAVELQQHTAALIRESVALNGFEDAVEVWGRRVGGPQEGCPPEHASESSATSAVSGDCLLQRWGGRADLVSVFTAWADGDILEGLQDSLRSDRVGVALIRTLANVGAQGVMDFVDRLHLRYDIQTFRGGTDTRLVLPGLLGRHGFWAGRAVPAKERAGNLPMKERQYEWTTIWETLRVDPSLRARTGARCAANASKES